MTTVIRCSYYKFEIIVSLHFSFQAHRLVLAAHSEYFLTMINQAMKQNTQELPVIYVDSDITMISNLLQFMYTGEISVSSSGIKELQDQAEKYSISRLVELCKSCCNSDMNNSLDLETNHMESDSNTVPVRWEYNSPETPHHPSSLHHSRLGAPVPGTSDIQHTMQDVSRVDPCIMKQEMTDSPINDAGYDRSGKSTLSSNITKGTTPALSSLIPIVSQFMVPGNTHLDSDRLDTIVVKREANSDDDLEMVCDELVDSNLRHVSGMAKSNKRGPVYASTSVQKYIKIAPRPKSHKTDDMPGTAIK